MCARLEVKEAEVERATTLLEEEAEAWETRDAEVQSELRAANAQLAAAQELCSRTLAGAEANASRAAALELQCAALQQRTELAERRAAELQERCAGLEREALAAREERRAEAARAAEALAEAAAARATQEQTLRDSEAARAQSEALLGRLAAVASSLSDRCAQLTQQTEQPAAHDPQPPPLEVIGRPRAPPAAARQQQQAGPLTLPALLALLRSAEVELSQLDERLNDRGTSAEEAAQLQLQMGSVGKRLRAVAALRGALSRQR